MSNKSIEKDWTDIASKQLLGLRIVKVRYMSAEEAEEMGWVSRPVVLQLSNGNVIFPSSDDEGNDGGAIFTNDETDGVLPVLRDN